MGDANISPVPFHHVYIDKGFWAKRIVMIRNITVRACIDACESTHRIDNFSRAAGFQDGSHEGAFFNDSDVYKVLEGVAYVLMGGKDAALELKADEIIDIICAAQQPDGYLYTYCILKMPDFCWQDMDHHEAYCIGHLLEAGIAYFQATGKDKLLNASIRAVRQMMSVIGPNKRHWVTGHQEIELALIRLWRLTGDQDYLEYAQWLVEERGHTKLQLPLSSHKTFFTDEYCQNDKPARELDKVTGHAVRAMYYYAALSDLASIFDDDLLDAALLRLWNNVVPANLYLTGGIGQSAYNEGFTRDWSLPSLTAYCETCAAVGMVFWNSRMNCIHGQARYADLVELEMYNGILSGISLSGDTFFYENPLASIGIHHRRKWFGVPCCPTNLVRFIPSIGGYAYLTSPGKLYINQFIDTTVSISIDGHPVKARVETDYPWSGNVRINISTSQPVTILLRKPGWCESSTLTQNGHQTGTLNESGYFEMTVHDNDIIVYCMEMPVRHVYSDPRVTENVGRIAVMRGPLVYCAEEIDNPGIPTEYFHSDLALKKSKPLDPIYKPDMLSGVTTLQGEGITLIPYYAWDNRSSGGMAVWLRESN